MSRHLALHPVILLTLAIAVIFLAAASASAQNAAAGHDTGQLPVSLLIDNVMSSHEQDIKDRMFDYEFDHTTSEAEKQSIVGRRSDDLQAAISERQAFLEALNKDKDRGLITGDRLDAMINETKGGIGRIGGSANKLRVKAQKLNGPFTAKSVLPLIATIDNASYLADNISKNANNKGNADNNMPVKLPQSPGDMKDNKK